MGQERKLKVKVFLHQRQLGMQAQVKKKTTGQSSTNGPIGSMLDMFFLTGRLAVIRSPGVFLNNFSQLLRTKPSTLKDGYLMMVRASELYKSTDCVSR